MFLWDSVTSDIISVKEHCQTWTFIELTRLFSKKSTLFDTWQQFKRLAEKYKIKYLKRRYVVSQKEVKIYDLMWFLGYRELGMPVNAPLDLSIE